MLDSWKDLKIKVYIEDGMLKNKYKTNTLTMLNFLIPSSTAGITISVAHAEKR